MFTFDSPYQDFLDILEEDEREDQRLLYEEDEAMIDRMRTRFYITRSYGGKMRDKEIVVTTLEDTV